MSQSTNSRPPNSKRSKALASGASASAIALTLAAPSKAAAQSDGDQHPDDYLEASRIDALESYEVLGDGRVKVFLDNGQSIIVETGQFTIEDGVLWLDPDVLAGIELGGGGPGLLAMVALPLAGAGAAVGAFAGGGGDSGPANNVPIFSSPRQVTVDENQTAAYTAVATDADGQTLTYSLSGADAARFNIDSATGVVTFITAPNFEAPADANGDNIYDIIVSASDGVDSSTRSVQITVNNLPDTGASPVFTTGANISVAENQTGVATISATDADSPTLTYAISGGADASKFQINSATGQLTFISAPDFEAPGDVGGNNVYNVQVTVSDGVNNTNRTFNVTVTDAADSPVPPVITSAATASVDENQSVAYTATATDANGDPLTYSITGGVDAGLFTINASTGVVSFITAADFEAPADAGGNNVYDIVVTASDGTLTDSQAVAITVNDLNDTTASVFGVAIFGTTANSDSGAALASGDIDGDGVADLVIGAPAETDALQPGAAYVVFGNEILADADGSINLESNTSSVRVTFTGLAAGDQGGLAVSTVADIDGDGKAEVLIGAPAQASATLAGKAFLVTSTMINAARAGAGVIDLSTLGTSGVTFTTSSGQPDELGYVVESAGDVDNDGIADVIVTARENDLGGSNRGTAYVVFGSTIAAELSGGDGVIDLAAMTNSQGVRITGDANGSLYGTTAFHVGDINNDGFDDIAIGGQRADPNGIANAGQVAIVYGSALNAEKTGGDGIISLAAFAAGTDGLLFNGAIAQDGIGNQGGLGGDGDANGDGVPDLVFAGRLANSSAGVAYLVWGDRALIDPNGTIETSALGVDGIIFAGVEAGDQLGRTINFVGDIDGDGLDDLLIGAPLADGDLNASGAAGDAYLIWGSTLAAERTGDGVINLASLGSGGITFYGRLSGGQLGYASTFIGDLDNDGFDDLAISARSINSRAGETYVISGAVLVAEKTTGDGIINIGAITPVGAAGSPPAFTSGATASVTEGATAAYTAAATDPDGGTVTYSITGGADAALFSINATTGAVTFNAAPDFEAPADAGVDNVYDIIITADDGSLTSTQAVAITVTNINDNAPVITSSNAVSVQENQSSAVTVAATDADAGTTIVYSITGGADAALFSINSNTGVVTFNATPDFEAPGDAGADNVYNITVGASDGATTTTQNVAITVTNVVELGNPPVFTSPTTASVQENQTSAYTAVATDADLGDTVTYSITGGADATLFSINTNTGVVTFNSAPDFEAPADAGGNNIYDIEITATDGLNNVPQNVAITVTDVVETTPFAIVINGTGANTFTGYSLNIGDVDGDGEADVIIGAPSVSTAGGAGAVWVVYGSTISGDADGVINLSTITAGQGVRIDGVAVGDLTGNTVKTIADIDGDGHSELFIGASAATTGTGYPNNNVGASGGRGYIVYSSTLAAENTGDGVIALSALGTGGITFTNGGAADDELGVFVQSAGDVDNDGLEDYIIGADANDANGTNQGATYLVWGSTIAAEEASGDGVIALNTMLASEGVKIFAGVNGYRSGWGGAGFGDFDGDGFDDIAVSAPRASPTGTSSGQIFVISGATLAAEKTLDGVATLNGLTPGTNVVLLNGLAAQDNTGQEHGVNAAGDVDGDGVGDLLVGARLADPTGASSGIAYLIYGDAINADADGLMNLGSLTNLEGIRFNGVSAGDQLGWVGSAGDIDGDGEAEILLGARLGDTFGSGETYLIWSSTIQAEKASGDGLIDLATLASSGGGVILFGASSSQAGFNFSFGDVNGDGQIDITIGAPNTSTATGTVYVLSGVNIIAEKTGDGLIDLGAITPDPVALTTPPSPAVSQSTAEQSLDFGLVDAFEAANSITPDGFTAKDFGAEGWA